MRRLTTFAAFIALLLASVTLTAGADDKSPATRPAPFEKEIEAFEKSDRAKPPPQDANLFIGSSSIAKWTTLADDFPGVPVINRGFGGSQIGDSTHFAERIVLPYHPKRIFFYAGDNDLAAGKTPEQVAADFKGFVGAVRAGAADVPIYFISIKPSPLRARLIDKTRQANQLIQAYAKDAKGVTFVDVYTPILGSDGQPRPELFGPDKLHMNHKGYEVWIGIITPLMK
jgi:lysophospholipase L1-like esterase